MSRRLQPPKIEATIDLHGLTLEEAYARLLPFLASAEARGKRGLLIITGKGKGALRYELPLWLDSPKIRGKIASIGPAPQEKGGEGALYVLLKKPS